MIRIEVAGESALILYFADTASAEVSACIQQVQTQLHAHLGDALVDMVPSYASLLVIFNPLVIDALAVKKAAREIYAKAEATSQQDWLCGGITRVLPPRSGTRLRSIGRASRLEHR